MPTYLVIDPEEGKNTFFQIDLERDELNCFCSNESFVVQ